MQTLANQIQPTGGKPPYSGPIPPGRPPSYGGPTPPGGQPPFHVLSGGNLPFPVIPRSLIHRWQGGKFHLLETLHNPREYLPKAHLLNSMLGGTHIITHKEEYQIMFLPDHLMDNLIWATSQTPPGVLKENNIILPMGLMCIHLQYLLLTLLKGTMFILFLGKKISQLIMLRTHQVMQMFLSHHRILFILVSNNCM
jgi:hypothetical protein